MKITLENTSTLVTIDGVSARVWEGETESGVAVVAFIPHIAVGKDADNSQFECELVEGPPLRPAVVAWPLRMII